MSEAKLTDKQRIFIEAYLTCWNATEAARQAGYAGNDATLAVVGSENLRKPQIQGAIQERLKEKAMGADEVLARLADEARGSMADFMTIHESPLVKPGGIPIKDHEGKPIIRYFPELDLKKAEERGKLHLIKKLTYTAHGPSIELYDAQAAKQLLGKHHGLFKENDNILKYLDLSKLSSEQLERIKNGDDPIKVLLNQE